MTNAGNDRESRARACDDQQDVPSTVALLATHALARAIEIVEHATEIFPELLVARQAGGDAAGVDVLLHPIARLRSVSDCGADVGTNPLVSDDFVGVRDDIPQRLLRLVHLTVSRKADHGSPRLSVW